MSETRVLYPKLVPLSVIRIFTFRSSNFLITFCISQGAKNCPFFTLIIFPVLAADINRSVCLHKNVEFVKHLRDLLLLNIVQLYARQLKLVPLYLF